MRRSGKTAQAAPELSGTQIRRRAILELTGAEHDQYAEYPLGVIWRRNLIGAAAHRAGLEYARLRRRVEPHRNPTSCLAELVPSGAGTIDVIPEISLETRALYLRLREALRAADRRCWQQVQNIVVYEQWPRFLDTARKRPPAAWAADERDLAALRSGLDIIARILDIHGKHGELPSELRDSVASFALRRGQRLGGGVANDDRFDCAAGVAGHPA